MDFDLRAQGRDCVEIIGSFKDYGLLKYKNRVVATDGRQNDTTRVNITVININDWDPR